MLTRSQQLLRALNLGSEDDIGAVDSSSDEDLLPPLASSLNAEANEYLPSILTPSFTSGPASQAEVLLSVPAPQLDVAHSSLLGIQKGAPLSLDLP